MRNFRTDSQKRATKSFQGSAGKMFKGSDLMAKKEMAPTCCPKCGEEKLWGSNTNPNFSAKKAAAYGISRIFLGVLPSALIAQGAKATMVYRCGKCGFTGKYKED